MNITGFVICLNNEDYSASLELHKIYAVQEALSNDPTGYLRIVDESGEDYLYPEEWFESVHLGNSLEARIMQSVSA